MKKRNTSLNFGCTREQAYYEPWLGQFRKVRFAGRCVVCGSTTYQTQDPGEGWVDPDPRGHIPPPHCGASLEASDFDRIGPDVPCCYACRDDAKKNAAARAIAETQWKEKP